MSVLGSDTLTGGTVGSALAGRVAATGGTWAQRTANAYAGFAAQSGGGYKGAGNNYTATHLPGSAATGDIYAQVTANHPGTGGYADSGVMLSAGNDQDYCLALEGTGSGATWKLIKDQAVNLAASVPISVAPTFGVPQTARLRREVVGSTARLTVYIGGVQAGQYTDSSSPYIGSMTAGLGVYGGSATFTAFESGINDLDPLAPTTLASHAGFRYTGRWGASGSTRITICPGAMIDFAFTGASCTLCFDPTGVTKTPQVLVRVDDGEWTRTNVAPSGLVALTLAAASSHRVRVVANVDSEYPDSYDNWASRRDAVKFTGVFLQTGTGAMLTVPPLPAATLEVLGDSITAGLRATWTSGAADGPAVASPHQAFGVVTAELLGLIPDLCGHGGQGVTTTGTDGAPIAASALPYVYGTTAYTPGIQPSAVVLYYGTNDGSISQAQYQTLLTAARAARPNALIFAVVPHGVTSTRRTSILAAVTAQADAKIVSLDYSSGVITTGDFCDDGLHPSVSGHRKMGVKLAYDIGAELTGRGYILAVPGAAGGGLRVSAFGEAA